MNKIIIILIILFCMNVLHAETVVLNNGDPIYGKLVGKMDGWIYLELNYGNVKIPQTNIKEIQGYAGPITDITLKKNDYFKSSHDKGEFVRLGEMSKVNEKQIYDTSIFGKENYIKVKFRVNVPDYHVKVNDNDPLLIKDKSFETLLGKNIPHVFIFSKNGYRDEKKTVTLDNDATNEIFMQQDNSSKDYRSAGYVTLDSYPKNAMIYIDNIQMEFAPKQLRITAGEHTITLQKDWYQLKRQKITVEEKETIDLNTITLIEDFGLFSVTTEPAGAKVFLNDKFIGTAPIKEEKLLSGNYTISAYLQDYYPQEIAMTLKRYDKLSIPINLDPAFGKLIIKSAPSYDATVYINDETVGTTPYTNAKFPSGTYLISVEKENWFGGEKEVTVSDGIATEETFELTRNFGRIRINASGCKIYLDDKFLGSNSVVEDVKSGDYIVRATKKNHYDDSKEISIEADEDKEVELNPAPILASLDIVSEPYATKGASIKIDGKTWPEGTPSIMETIIGQHTVSVSYPKYITQARKVKLQKGDNKELIFSLVPYKNSATYKMKKWRTWKWIYFTTAILAAGAGGGCHYLGMQNYDKYQNATSSSAAETYKDNYEKWYKYRDYSFKISIAPAVLFLYSWIKEGYYAGKAKLEMGDK